MISRILVPLDGSPLAEQALRCATMVARGTGATLVLFRAVSLPSELSERLIEAGQDPGSVLAQLTFEAGSYLRGLEQQLHERGMRAEHRAESGQPAQAILDYAAQSAIDQIVMATHGYTGFKRWTHGSVAERVLQAASVPVLMLRVQHEDVARDWLKPVPCGRILVPLDGSPTAEEILPVAGELARAVGAELILFQVPIAHATGWMTGEWYIPVQGVLATAETDARAYLERVAQRLEQQDVSVATATTIGSVSECIVDYAEASAVNLIAMCTHGRTGLARWTLGSVADRVLRAGATPILLVRAGASADTGRVE